MNTENIKSQMRKGILEYCILSIIKKTGSAYVLILIEELKKVNLIVVEGTIYPIVTRLKNAEFLTYHWEESNSGPPRKYYSITEKGDVFLEELAQTWVELNKSVNKITKN